MAIVGGGVIGLTSAWFLARAGLDVVVVERGKVGQGCSSGNGGWISPSISSPLPVPGLTLLSLWWLLRRKSPLYIKPGALPSMAGWLMRSRSFATRADYQKGLDLLARLNRPTMSLFDEMAAGGVNFEMHCQGLLVAFRSQKKLDKGHAEMAAMKAAGVAEYEVLGSTALMDAEPALAGKHVGGLLVSSDRHVRPETLMIGLFKALRREGVEVIENCNVSGVRAEGSRAVCLITDQGEISATDFILAAGVHTGLLAAACGTQIPLTAGKGYSITIDHPLVQLQRPLILAEAKIFLTPYAEALRVSGTLEFSGINNTLDRRRVRMIRRDAAAQVAIQNLTTGGREWVGLRPVVPDTLPVIGRLSTQQNVFAATGHQMLGITLAPSTAVLLRDLILGKTPAPEMAAFSPSRF